MSKEWNVTTLIRWENNVSFFAAFYCSCLGLNALLALKTKEGSNMGVVYFITFIYFCKICSPLLMKEWMNLLSDPNISCSWLSPSQPELFSLFSFLMIFANFYWKMGLIDQFSPGFLLILAFSLGKGSSLYSLSIFCLSSSRVKLDLRFPSFPCFTAKKVSRVSRWKWGGKGTDGYDIGLVWGAFQGTFEGGGGVEVALTYFIIGSNYL